MAARAIEAVRHGYARCATKTLPRSTIGVLWRIVSEPERPASAVVSRRCTCGCAIRWSDEWAPGPRASEVVDAIAIPHPPRAPRRDAFAFSDESPSLPPSRPTRARCGGTRRTSGAPPGSRPRARPRGHRRRRARSRPPPRTSRRFSRAGARGIRRNR
eukprot:29225-Pelagococcus_subviridis.AAC.12